MPPQQGQPTSRSRQVGRHTAYSFAMVGRHHSLSTAHLLLSGLDHRWVGSATKDSSSTFFVQGSIKGESNDRPARPIWMVVREFGN